MIIPEPDLFLTTKHMLISIISC